MFALSSDYYSIAYIAYNDKHEKIVKYLQKNIKDYDKFKELILLRALKINNLNVIKNLHKKNKLNMNLVDENGLPPIFIAVSICSIKVLSYLIEDCKADYNIKTKDNKTLFQFAVEKHVDINKIYYLYEKSNKDNNDNKALLHFALTDKNISLVKYAFEKYKPDQNDTKELFQHALKEGNLDIIKYVYETCKPDNYDINALINYSFKKDIKFRKYVLEKYKSNNIKDLLHIAIEQKNFDLIKIVIETYKYESSDIKELLQFNIEIKDLDFIKYIFEKCKPNNNDINDLLNFAIKLKYINFIKYAYEKYRPDIKDNKDLFQLALKGKNTEIIKYIYKSFNPSTNDINELLSYILENRNLIFLEYVFENFNQIEINNKIKHDKILDIIFEQHSLITFKNIYEKLKITPYYKNVENLNVCHLAVRSNKLYFFKYLWEKYPDKNYIIEPGGEKNWTPFHYAISLKNSEFISFFVEKCKIDLKIKSKNEDLSVMGFAARYGNAYILSLLKKYYEFNINEIYDKRHILFLSVQYGNLDALEFFLDKNKIDPNYRDYRGWTPMHVASYFGHLKIIKYLVEKKGCTAFVSDDQGFTPAMLARQENHEDIVNYLKDNFGTLLVGVIYY